jgi:putative ABC transport system permease protein
MLLAAVRLALRTLRGNLFRTVLTMLSVTIGSFSIVVMLSLAQSGQKTLASTIERIGGMRMVLWFPAEEHPLSARDRAVYDQGFTDRDMDTLRNIPYLAAVASQSTFGTEEVWASADNRHKADIVGAREGMLEILNWNVSTGRVIELDDNLEKKRVALLTAPLAEELFPRQSSASVIGQTVLVGRKPYRVVGILEKRDTMGIHFGFSWEKSIFVPQLTAEVRDGRTDRARFFVGQTEDASRNASVVHMANAALLANHRGVEDFQSLDFSGFLQKFYTFFLVLDLIVALIAGVSLFAGGIGVMNIMLVSITERVREIGIRKAVGASRLAILSQFLIEACVLSLTGGLLGVSSALLVTFGANTLIRHFQETWLGTYSLMGVALSFGSTAGIGLIFGAVPAWRASRLDIVECLRR